ncbi:hypothetical protein D9Q98_001354 [Chlorella vulgaris]|uniref:Uncharacterized protein n=1 Tax=Chlorella vulgaris TaxID=3077 RepID=A0A9D4Z2K0_CHLVU|nr:hypothetical protein D9Q98_001354 [Chlorella vulgaris]
MVRRSNVVAALLILVLLVAEVNASRDLQAEGSKRPKAKPVAPPSTKVDKNCATSVSAGVKKVTDQYQKQVTSLTAEVTSLKKYRSQVGELLKMLLKMKTKLDATNVQTELAQVQSENEDLQSQLDNCNQGNTETTTNTNDSTNDNTNDSTNDTGETTADTGSDN